MPATTSRLAAFAAATTLTLAMLAGIDGLAQHPSQDARLAALQAPAASRSAPTVNASLAAPGCPAPAAATHS